MSGANSISQGQHAANRFSCIAEERAWLLQHIFSSHQQPEDKPTRLTLAATQCPAGQDFEPASEHTAPHLGVTFGVEGRRIGGWERGGWVRRLDWYPLGWAERRVRFPPPGWYQSSLRTHHPHSQPPPPPPLHTKGDTKQTCC
ncbi:unnamed protein product [Pleuronectes platessa]|uniref:Uncharacterized protein n=1 Tax=Pleuronectes platessa TaxID=8262 RepID=A0A9N7TMN4_PLEPL|nr:unnamed protein product [Pleuronectes platessa]